MNRYLWSLAVKMRLDDSARSVSGRPREMNPSTTSKKLVNQGRLGEDADAFFQVFRVMRLEIDCVSGHVL